MKKRIFSWIKKLSNEKKPERIQIQKVFFVPRNRAYLCTNCDVIGASARMCPRCESNALINVSRFIKQHKDTIRLTSHENIRSGTQLPDYELRHR
jgi:hypothetical protein